MPLFLMLSGFALAVTYGKKPYHQIHCCSGSSDKNEQQHINNNRPAELSPFDIKPFAVNRFMRAMPSYYLTALFAVPLVYLGFGDVAPTDQFRLISTYIVNFFPIPLTTLFSFGLGSAFDGPAWTVATLMVFWCMFPQLVTRAQAYDDQTLLQSIKKYFYIQIGVLLLAFLVSMINFWIGFASATMNPITRWPLFVMGIHAGILCLRHNPQLGQDIPWLDSFLWIFPHSKSQTAQNTHAHHAADAATISHIWGKILDSYSAFLLIFTLLVAGADYAFKLLTSLSNSILGALWLQAIVPFAQLTVIVGLTRIVNLNDSKALLFLNNSLLKWFGKISMAIYLIHYPVMRYICWGANGFGILNWPSNNQECSSSDSVCQTQLKYFNQVRLLPGWGIPLGIGITLVLACALFYGFEEPLRLMSKKKSSSQQKDQQSGSIQP